MDKENNNTNNKISIKKVGEKAVQFSKEHPIIAGTVLVGGLAFGGIPLLVSGVGFSSGGIVAGSTAASIASTLGSGSAIVSTAQAIGATGTLFVAGKTAVVVGISTVVGGRYIGKKFEEKYDIPKAKL
ncbi:hypothetical protein ACTFIZ_010176 [Dictyostelium cf. discoideum]